MITVKYIDDERHAKIDQRLYMAIKIGGDANVASQLQLDGYYIPVLKIDSDDLEYAFTVMQNGVKTPSWLLEPLAGMRPLVKPIIEQGSTYGWRSACVGDIFNLNGVDYICGNVGFQIMNDLAIDTGGCTIVLDKGHEDFADGKALLSLDNSCDSVSAELTPEQCLLLARGLMRVYHKLTGVDRFSEPPKVVIEGL